MHITIFDQKYSIFSNQFINYTLVLTSHPLELSLVVKHKLYEINMKGRVYLSRSVTIITPGSFPIPSPTTSSVESSIMNMAPYLAKKISVTVLGRKFQIIPSRIEIDGVVYINFSSLNVSEYLNQVMEHLKKYPSTIIQVENRPHYVEWVKRELPDSNVWLVLHSITFLQSRGLRRQRLIKSMSFADRIVVNSHFLKQYVVGMVPNIEKKIVVNHLGVNPDLFLSRYDKRQTALRELDMKKLNIEGKKVVLFVGRLQKKKGVHQLLKTAKMFEKQMNDVVLLIVGSHSYGKHISTPYVRYLRRLATPYLERNKIRHIPFVSTDQIHRYYRLADVVVVPSTGPEAFGLVNLEAMSTEVPVIATNVGGIPEIIRHHDNGILISLSNHVPEMAEALCQIFADEEWARKLGKKGREDIINLFSWEHVANRLYHYYSVE